MKHKNENPISKSETNSSVLISKMLRIFENWNFNIVWNLELGYWNLPISGGIE
jgi:hypothetical protein